MNTERPKLGSLLEQLLGLGFLMGRVGSRVCSAASIGDVDGQDRTSGAGSQMLRPRIRHPGEKDPKRDPY